MKNVLLIFLSFFLVSSAQAGLEGAESFEVCAKYQRSIFSWSDEFDGQAYLLRGDKFKEIVHKDKPNLNVDEFKDDENYLFIFWSTNVYSYFKMENLEPFKTLTLKSPSGRKWIVRNSAEYPDEPCD